MDTLAEACDLQNEAGEGSESESDRDEEPSDTGVSEQLGRGQRTKSKSSQLADFDSHVGDTTSDPLAVQEKISPT